MLNATLEGGRRGHPAAVAPAALAADLAGEPCAAVRPVAGGGNSRVYRVCTRSGARYALKRYPDAGDDPRERLGREWAALRLMERLGVDTVPRPLACDRPRHAALYSWLDGTPVAEPGAADIDRLAAFLARLHGLRGAAEAAAFPWASAACPTPAHLEAQIHRRLERLRATPLPEPVGAFLEESFRPCWARLRRAYRHATRAAGLAPDQAVPLTLSPADAGFHNALRTPRGLVHVDFEYFGRDDPVKLVADILLHPRGAPPPALRRPFLGAVQALYGGGDPDFAARLERGLPLYALVWCLILLNVFLPGGARAAAPAAGDALRRERLGRARALLRHIPVLREEVRDAL